MNRAVTDEQIVRALIDPGSVFANPMAVVDEAELTIECKIEILRRWEYDAKEQQVAIEEGFPAGDPDMLLETVIAALHKLGAGPDLEHSPPTKQGGV